MSGGRTHARGGESSALYAALDPPIRHNIRGLRDSSAAFSVTQHVLSIINIATCTNRRQICRYAASFPSGQHRAHHKKPTNHEFGTKVLATAYMLSECVCRFLRLNDIHVNGER